MTRLLFAGAFAIGLIAIIWIGRLFFGVDALGLGVTVLICVAYLVGTLELISFRRSTATITQALECVDESKDDFNAWLGRIAPSLQNTVRSRVNGARIALPAPVATPYLVGLLVMLGLIGTFVGMVDTLRGAVVALEGTSELEAIRAGLAAPIEGLGLAFGTSVAGVAASAMLGLLSTISRRERLLASQELDTFIHSHMAHYSMSHQQTQAFVAIQEQAKALPNVVEQLSTLATSVEQMSERVSDQLVQNQQQFHARVADLYGELNTAIDQSLKSTLRESAEQLSAVVQPMAEQTFKKLDDATVTTQQTLHQQTEAQLSTLRDLSLGHQTQSQDALMATLQQQTVSADSLLAKVSETVDAAMADLQSHSTNIFKSVSDSNAKLAEQQSQQAEKISAVMQQELSNIREQESTRNAAALSSLSQIETVFAKQLSDLGQALEEPMTRLIKTASETPKAAAEVIEKLRGEMTKNIARDNDLLKERKVLMQQLEGLSKTLDDNSRGQREAVDHLLAHSAETLTSVGSQFSEHVHSESAKLSDVAQHFASSSVEMASLSEAFNAAVNMFRESNTQLIENLTRIEASLEKSTSRSDEQLAYYVSQAREIIDHNMMSHQHIIAALNDQQPTQLAVKGVDS